MICDIVTNMFYPFDLKGDTKAKYREMIKGVLDKYTVKGEINEEDFCLAMVYDYRSIPLSFES